MRRALSTALRLSGNCLDPHFEGQWQRCLSICLLQLEEGKLPHPPTPSLRALWREGMLGTLHAPPTPASHSAGGWGYPESSHVWTGLEILIFKTLLIY